MRIWALDPGKEGAIAELDGAGSLRTIRLPPDPVALADLLLSYDLRGTLILEDVGYHRRGNSATSSCTFARHCGYLDGLLYPAVARGDLRVVKISPRRWQRGIPLPREKGAHKEGLFLFARSLFPGAKFPKYAADAVCLLGLRREILEGVELEESVRIRAAHHATIVAKDDGRAIPHVLGELPVPDHREPVTREGVAKNVRTHRNPLLP